MKGHPLLVTADIHSSEEALEAVIALGAQLSASRLLIAGDLCPHSQRMALLVCNSLRIPRKIVRISRER